MRDIESWKKDEQFRKSLYDIAICVNKIGDEIPNDFFRQIDVLPKCITISNGKDVYDYVFTIFNQDHSGNSDAYFAMFSRRYQKLNSKVNFLFSVCGSTFPKVLNRFLFVYRQLCELGVIKNSNWKCIYKNINFCDIDDIKLRFYSPL